MSDEEHMDEVQEQEEESPEALDYILRGRSLREQLMESIRATPWWMVSVALHLAAILVLSKIVYMSAASQMSEHVVVTTDIKTEEIKPIDLKQLKKTLEKVKKDLKAEPVVKAPTLVDMPKLSETVETDMEAPAIEDTDLEADLGEADFDEDFIGLDDAGAGAGDDYGIGKVGSTMGIGEGGFTPRGMTTYKKVLEDMTVRITGKLSRKKRGNVLLIWIMDSSLSMKDDQEEIKKRLWEMDTKFRALTNGGRLYQAVVYFSDQPRLWLEPTNDVEMVMKAVDSIELSPPGTPENVMAALMFVASRKEFSSVKAKKVAVLVDDDNSYDTGKLEDALAALKKKRISLYVINRECPFQRAVFYERFTYVDEKGLKYTGTGRVFRGPETAYPEVTSVVWGGFIDRTRIMSGFGIYDVSRIAFHTGGAYYILGEAKADYDWKLMEAYAPELVSRDAYKKRTAKNPYKETLEYVSRKWNTGCPHGNHYPWPELAREEKRCRAKLEQADDLIQLMRREAIMSHKALAKLKKMRRWPANADLTWVSLILAKHRIRQYLYAIQEFKSRNKSIPKDHHIFLVHGQEPRGPMAEKDKEDVVEAMRFLANRHPRTPWGLAVSQFNPDSRTYIYGIKLVHRYWFQPYWALIDAHNGRLRGPVRVYGFDKKKRIYAIEVPYKGPIRIHETKITRLVKMKEPYRGGGVGHPRI